MQRPPKSLSFSLSFQHIVTLTPMEENVVEEEEQVSFSSDPPLFSCFITLSTLILIYSPNDSFRILLSPVLLTSLALLISLLRLGSTQEPNTRPGKSKEESNVLVDVSSLLSEARHETGSDKRHDFVEWDLRAPLEVIHEAYEEDDDYEGEEEDPSGSGVKDPTRFREIERYPSLSLCYPESDSESDSDSSSEFSFPEMGSWISPEKMGYRWEEEEEEDGGGGLIEIKLDDEYKKKKKKKMSKQNQTEMDFHAEEDGLIEIDLFQ